MRQAKIIDGRSISKSIKENIKKEVELASARGVTPGLATILVGEDPASVSYVRGKRKALAEVGMNDFFIQFPIDVTEAELIEKINTLNKDDTVHGILVQLPLPAHISESKVINAISPNKDVDGFNPISMGNLALDKPGFIPCTPNGIIKLLQLSGIEMNGKNAVVIGRSNIVGKPIALLLSRKSANCTVTLCHTGTKNLRKFTKKADIIIVASGHPHTLTKGMIKRGAIIVDVGINRIEDPSKKSGYRLIGDCDFADLKKTAAYITPVPGGVGPMTIAMLMFNVLESAKQFKK